MDKLELKPIAGKTPDKIKARVWREMTGFDPFKDDRFDFNGTVERIALFYGVTPDEVLDELDVSELFPTFVGCVKYLNSQVLRALDETPKKKEETTSSD